MPYFTMSVIAWVSAAEPDLITGKIRFEYYKNSRVNKKPKKFIFEYWYFHKNPYLHT